MEVWIRQSMAYHPHVDGPMPYPVPGWMWDRELGQQLYKERMPFIQRMEDVGFDGIIFTEHHYGPNGGLTPSPMIALAAATQVTEQIKLVTMGIDPIGNSPEEFADFLRREVPRWKEIVTEAGISLE